MPRLDFIDISHWQSDRGAIDWGEVSQAGVIGAIIKASEGTSYVDPGYVNNAKGALAAGLFVATYHFLKKGNVTSQMGHYLSTVQPNPGERLVIDYEDEKLSYGDLRDAVDYLKRAAPDCHISVYGSAKLRDDVRAAGSQAAIDLADTSLWAARYSSSQPEVATNAWPTWTGWQYSDRGSIPGIDGDVDLNSFNGSRENCAQWIGPPTEVPVVPPEPVPPDVQAVYLSVPEKQRVYVNGRLVWPTSS
jgi:lysozyme